MQQLDLKTLVDLCLAMAVFHYLPFLLCFLQYLGLSFLKHVSTEYNNLSFVYCSLLKAIQKHYQR